MKKSILKMLLYSFVLSFILSSIIMTLSLGSEGAGRFVRSSLPYTILFIYHILILISSMVSLLFSPTFHQNLFKSSISIFLLPFCILFSALAVAIFYSAPKFFFAYTIATPMFFILILLYQFIHFRKNFNKQI